MEKQHILKISAKRKFAAEGELNSTAGDTMAANDKADLEGKSQVVITPEDCQECAKFFQFFEIPVPAGLQSAMDAFIAEPTLLHQDELKFQLADVITHSQHPVFQDEVFAQIRPETAAVRDELAFERELEAQLTSNE
jgi:hypothetical protein